MSDRPDVLLLSLGTTLGWRVADEQFVDQLRAAGVTVAAESVRIGASGRLRRAYPVTDLVEAVAARRALARSARSPFAAGARDLDHDRGAAAPGRAGCPTPCASTRRRALNRPGPRNLIVHLLERRALARARLVLPWSRAAAIALPAPPPRAWWCRRRWRPRARRRPSASARRWPTRPT